MKCFFNDGKDAQGTCQQCGLFACKEHASIIEGKFICTSCSNKIYELEPIETIKEAERVIDKDYKNLKKCSCNNCNTRFAYECHYSDDSYPSFEDYYIKKLLGNRLWDILEVQKNTASLVKKYFTEDGHYHISKCPNKCFLCKTHRVKVIDSRTTFFSSYDTYLCHGCGSKWEEKYYEENCG